MLRTLLASIALTLAAGAAFPAPPASRAEALAALEHPVTERRAEAVAAFSEVIRSRPDFAEGWNKRATAHYLAGEYRQSLSDCDEVVKRNPYHFGALSGYGQIYFQMQDYEKAMAWWRRALEVNPNMVEVEINIEGAEQLLKEKRGRST